MQARIEKDNWRSLEELHEKNDQLILTNEITKVKTDEYILFFKLCIKDIPKILFSVKITVDLQVTVFLHGLKLKESHVRDLCSTDLNTCSSLNEIFEHLTSQEDINITDQDFLDDIVERLHDQRFDGNAKVAFRAEQLALISKTVVVLILITSHGIFIAESVTNLLQAFV